MAEFDLAILLIPIALSGVAIFMSTWAALSNIKRAEKKDVLELARQLQTEQTISDRITDEEIADMQRRLSHLEGRQTERDRRDNKGAV